MGNCFWHYYRQIFISLVLRKCKKDSDELKIILVQRFSPLKVKIARFLVGFRRNYLMCSTVLRLINEGGKQWFFLTVRWSVYVTPGCFKTVCSFGLRLFTERWNFDENEASIFRCFALVIRPVWNGCLSTPRVFMRSRLKRLSLGLFTNTYFQSKIENLFKRHELISNESLNCTFSVFSCYKD